MYIFFLFKCQGDNLPPRRLQKLTKIESKFLHVNLSRRGGGTPLLDYTYNGCGIGRQGRHVSRV